METSYFFQAGGTVNSTSACYISRACDNKAFQTIFFERRYLTVLGPRQVGKTSLLYKLQANLEEKSIPCAIVDLSTLQGVENEVPSFWYNLLTAHLHHQLRRSDADIYRDKTVHDLSSFIAFLNSFEVVSGAKKRAVIMFDEAAAVPSSLKQQFFSRLRYLFNNRPNPRAEPATRFDFVFAGAFYPSALVTETTVSPFNVSNEVRVPDFQRPEVDKLFAQLHLEQEAADEIWNAVGGHPFLTQKICQNLAHNCQGIITPTDVQAQVNDILQHDAHLQNVVRRLDESPAEVKLIRRVILKRERVRVNPNVNAVAAQLEMIGALTVGPDGFARVRNGIYGRLLRNYLSDRDKTS